MRKNLLANVTNKLSVKMGRTGLILKKNAPEIALVGGITGIIGTVVLACYETTKAGEIIDRHQERLDRIQEAVNIVNEDENNDLSIEYTSKDIGRDKFICYSKTTIEFVKLYGPSIITGTLSIGMILWSHGLLKKRYLGAVAAYNAVSEAFNAYRDRVRKEEGDEADRHYMYGTERLEQVNEIIDENGKKKKEKETIDTIPENTKQSEFVRIWDRSSKAYNTNPNISRMFLTAQEEIANNILNTKNHIFLNEVLDMLGYEHTPIGAVTGWVKGNKDSYVSFGLNPNIPEVQRFIDGRTNTIPLEFNVDGVILSLI